MRDGSGFARRVTLQNLQVFAPLLRASAPHSDDQNTDSRSREDVDLDQANTSPADPALAAAEALFVGKPLEVKKRYRRATITRSGSGRRAETGVVEPPARTLPAPDLRVLVAEIPKAKNRWKQANFDLATFEGFFGAKLGTLSTIQLQHVGSDGTLSAVEITPSVEVKSRNFRFELQAASGLRYPSDGRPIAVFVQQPSGVFLYRLVMPNDVDHASLVSFLSAKWRGRADRMRRVLTTVQELQEYWPASPLWRVLPKA